MHEFKFKGKFLCCESVRLEGIAKKFGTPVYVYSLKTLLDHFRKIKRAFRSIDPLICFSMKSNSSLALCRALVKEGSGLDIVSGGELFKALKVGGSPRKIVFAGVGKTGKEIEQAIKAKILFFNVESEVELIAINNIAQRSGKVQDVCLRLNPDVEAHTHHYIATARKENKFGIDFDAARKIFTRRHLYQNVSIVGVHVHIGSQIVRSSPYIKMLKKVVKFIKELEREGITLTHLNIGGGLGIIYRRERPQTADEFARAVLPILKSAGLKIIMEPGRFIAGNSGVLLTRVTYLKKTKAKQFAIVDAGMNDLMRPSLYSAYHEILPLRKLSESKVKYDVVGPICESADSFAKDRSVYRIGQGSFLALMSSGAYGFSMSSNYNLRPHLAEVLVYGNNFYLIRSRQNYNDLIKGERILGFLK